MTSTTATAPATVRDQLRQVFCCNRPMRIDLVPVVAGYTIGDCRHITLNCEVCRCRFSGEIKREL